MKRLICILMCLLTLVGCSNGKNLAANENTQNQTEEKNQKGDNVPSVENKAYDTYSLFTGIKTEKGSWYYNVPYLNEITRGNATTFVNGDNWWLAFALKVSAETNDLDEGFELALKAYYSGVQNYFVPPEEGFNPEVKELVEVLDFDMYKFEGNIQNTKSSTGASTNCWIYGYSFIIGNTPCAMLGMTYEDNSDQAKQDIMMYVDNMVNSLRVE